MDIELCIGNNAHPCDDADQLLGGVEAMKADLRWCWDIYVAAGKHVSCIQHVVFHLPKCLEQSVAKVDDPNSADGSFHSFAYSGYEKSEPEDPSFNPLLKARIEIHLRKGWSPQVIEFDHWISLCDGGSSKTVHQHISHDLMTATNSDDTCMICLHTLPGISDLHVTACGHTFHQSCWQRYLTSAVAAPKVVAKSLEVQCLHCFTPVHNGDLLKSVGPESFQKYWQMKKSHAVDVDPDVCWCPSPDCGGILTRPSAEHTKKIVEKAQICELRRDLISGFCAAVASYLLSCWWSLSHSTIPALIVLIATVALRIRERYERSNVQIPKQSVSAGCCAECPKCGLASCFDCKTPWHPGKTCTEVEECRLKDWASGKDVGTCPTCKCVIEKNQGCSHMKCTMCHTDFIWENRIEMLTFGQIALTSRTFQSFLLLLSVIWCTRLSAGIRNLVHGNAFAGELQMALTEGCTQLMMAGLWVAGFAPVLAPLIQRKFSREARLHALYVPALAGVIIGRRLLSFCGLNIYIHLHSAVLLLGSWYLQAQAGFKFPNRLAAQQTADRLKILKSIYCLSAPYIVLILQIILARVLALAQSCSVDLSPQTTENHQAQALMRRRCALLAARELFCHFTCWCATFVGVGLIAVSFVQLQGPGYAIKQNGLLRAHYMARVATFAALVWVQAEGSQFEWAGRFGVFASIQVVMYCITPHTPYAPGYTVGTPKLAQILVVTGVFTCLLWERFNFYIEDGMLMLGVAFAFVRSAHLLKIGTVLMKKCILGLAGAFVGFAILAFDLSEDGSRTEFLPWCLVVLTPPICCVTPSRIKGILCDVFRSVVANLFGSRAGLTANGVHRTTSEASDNDAPARRHAPVRRNARDGRRFRQDGLGSDSDSDNS